MKKYLVFAGYNYYASGGWHDFQYCFEDLEAAKKFFDDMSESLDWGHIVESENIIWRWRRGVSQSQLAAMNETKMSVDSHAFPPLSLDE